MPFFQDSLSASSMNTEQETLQEQERLKLKTLASAPRGSRWSVKNGKFERANLWQKLSGPVKGWMGFKDTTHPLLIEYELIKFLSNGAANNLFKREDLYLIKQAARQAGLIRGIERSEKSHRDLATLINLIVKQVVQHQHLPTSCYQAYASRFYHHHKGLLKPLCPPPELSPYQPKAEDEHEPFSFERDDDDKPRSESSDVLPSDSEKPAKGEPVGDPMNAPAGEETAAASVREKTEWSISIIKKNDDKHSSSIFERKKLISFLALGTLAAMTLYRYRYECLATFFPTLNQQPVIYPRPPIVVNYPTINSSIPTSTPPSQMHAATTPVSVPDGISFPSFAEFGIAALCTALFTMIIRNCRQRQQEPLLPMYNPPLISASQISHSSGQTDQKHSKPDTKNSNETRNQDPQMGNTQEERNPHSEDESWDPEVVVKKNPISDKGNLSHITSSTVSKQEMIAHSDNANDSTLALFSPANNANFPYPQDAVTSLIAQSSNVVNGKKDIKILADEEILAYNRRPMTNVAQKLDKTFKSANKDKYLHVNHSETWENASWTFDNTKPENGERNKGAVMINDRIYNSFDENKYGSYVGVAYCQGQRPTMEDTHLVKHLEINGKRYPVFAIFDGHGNDSCSVYLQAFFETYLLENLPKALLATNREDAICQMLKLAFVHLGKDYRDAVELYMSQKQDTDEAVAAAGSTATIVLAVDGILYTANAGDTRAIISTPDKVIALSRDAKPEIKKFKKGVEKRGGSLIYDGDGVLRVEKEEGSLAPARAVGHDEVKSAINPRTEISKYNLSDLPSASSNFLVIACDGLWDVASSHQVSQTIQNFAKEKDTLKTQKPSPSGMAARLVRKAFNNGSQDNISVLVLDMDYLKTLNSGSN